MATAASAQAPIGGGNLTPATKPGPQPIPTSTPAPPGAPGQATSTPQPGQPAQPGPATPTWTPIPTMTLPPTFTPIPTWTPTVTSTSTPSPFPTFVPRVTPTLAWPTPAPGAYFRSRYLASVPDPSIPLASGGGVLRGRVVDWRGIGLDRFRIHISSPVGQMETATTGDGQYTFQNVPPGAYDVALPDYTSEPAKDVPVMAGRATTVDWLESTRVAGASIVLTPTVALSPSPTATPVPATLIERPSSSPARPPPVEVVALGIAARAAETMWNAFLTGVALVAVAAAITIALIRWRGSG